jgi:hypothetical protein
MQGLVKHLSGKQRLQPLLVMDSSWTLEGDARLMDALGR